MCQPSSRCWPHLGLWSVHITIARCGYNIGPLLDHRPSSGQHISGPLGCIPVSSIPWLPRLAPMSSRHRRNPRCKLLPKGKIVQRKQRPLWKLTHQSFPPLGGTTSSELVPPGSDSAPSGAVSELPATAFSGRFVANPDTASSAPVSAQDIYIGDPPLSLLRFCLPLFFLLPPSPSVLHLPSLSLLTPSPWELRDLGKQMHRVTPLPSRCNRQSMEVWQPVLPASSLQSSHHSEA